MSCVVAVQSGASGPTHLATVKGAPEVMRDMFKEVPSDYNAVHTKLARQGARVLALGHKALGNLSMREVRKDRVHYELSQASLEVGLKLHGLTVEVVLLWRWSF